MATSTTVNLITNYSTSQVSATVGTITPQPLEFGEVSGAGFMQFIAVYSYPAPGVMPSTSYGAPQSISSLTFSTNPATYPQSISITATCSTGHNCAVDYPTLGTHLCTGTTTCTYTYSQAALAAGTYSTYYGHDITTGSTTTGTTLTVDQNSTPETLSTLTGNQATPYTSNTVGYGTPYPANTQIAWNLWLNNQIAAPGSVGGSNTLFYNLNNQVGCWSWVFNTVGNANYIANSTSGYWCGYVPVSVQNATSILTLTPSGNVLTGVHYPINIYTKSPSNTITFDLYNAILGSAFTPARFLTRGK